MRNPILLAALVLAPAASAQLTWRTIAPAVRPGASDFYAMAETANPAGLLLFGGLVGVSPPSAETWQFTSGAWTRLQPATAPGARTGHSMCYDPVRDRVVLFGGLATPPAPGLSAETWEWGGQNWTLLQPAVSPPARHSAAMAFDPLSGEVVLFGGSGAGTLLDDTWAFDGATWRPIPSAYAPGPRSNHAMTAYGSFGLVLFGGQDAFGPLGDTWTYLTGQWYRQPLAGGPTPRGGHSLTYDPERERIVLHGGRTDGLDIRDETWEFLNFWREVVPAVRGPRLTRHAAAWDRQRQSVVVFGGATVQTRGGLSFRQPVDTMAEFLPTVRADITRVGGGCGGLSDVHFSGPPVLGDLGFRFWIDPVIGPHRFPAVAGLSLGQQVPPTTFGPCPLHLAAPITPLLSPPWGPGRFTLPIPDVPALRGLSLHLQVIGEEILAGTGHNGVGFSPGYRLTIGD